MEYFNQRTGVGLLPPPGVVVKNVGLAVCLDVVVVVVLVLIVVGLGVVDDVSENINVSRLSRTK